MNLESLLKAIGQKFRKLREDKKMTIAEVATAVDMSASQIGCIERGDRAASLPTLLLLAEYYQVPATYLFEDDLQQYHRQISGFLYDQLNARSLSIADLARHTDINYFALAEFFQGRTSLELGQLQRIAHTLGVATEQLLPQVIRYLNLIKYYLKALGLDDNSIQNVEGYIYSKFEAYDAL